MLNYFIRRLGFVIFVAWGVTLFTFLIAQVVPADPALVALGDRATDEQIAAFNVRNGLDKPVWIQSELLVG